MDLLVVADRRDAVAAFVAAAAARRDKTAVVLSHADASRLFTITGDAEGARVEPDVPILIRPALAPAPGRTSDETFLDGECAASLWAATALMRSNVLNRPTARGFEARWSPSGAITELRAAMSVAPEIYACSRVGDAPPDSRPWALEDARGRTHRWRATDAVDTPYRARPLLANEGYERLIVLDRSFWRTTTVDLSEFDVERRSIELAQALGLSFAVMTWGIDLESRAVRLARIDPYPRAEQLIPVWSELEPSLMEALGC